MQAPGLESVPTPELLSDAEILSSIKSTMTRKQTMSLPLHLLKGNPSLDALENALRAESTLLFPRAQSMRKRMVPGSQVSQPGHPFTPCIFDLSSTVTWHSRLGLFSMVASIEGMSLAANLHLPRNSCAWVSIVCGPCAR